MFVFHCVANRSLFSGSAKTRPQMVLNKFVVYSCGSSGNGCATIGRSQPSQRAICQEIDLN
jgi:hypothetical protein